MTDLSNGLVEPQDGLQHNTMDNVNPHFAKTATPDRIAAKDQEIAKDGGITQQEIAENLEEAAKKEGKKSKADILESAVEDVTHLDGKSEDIGIH